MSYAIVYSSKTGNTELLATTIKNALPYEECIYFGNPSETALKADKIYVGFWTDKGTADNETAQFMSELTNQKVFVFGTAGFVNQDGYYNKIMDRACQNLSEETEIIGTYMCQGKMPMAVRARYEKMKSMPNAMPNLDGMIENFDNALSHPDTQDLEALKSSLA